MKESKLYDIYKIFLYFFFFKFLQNLNIFLMDYLDILAWRF
jgi:hypothetical protein